MTLILFSSDILCIYIGRGGSVAPETICVFLLLGSVEYKKLPLKHELISRDSFSTKPETTSSSTVFPSLEL